MVWPGPIEWNRSWGDPIAEWKSIEWSIGAAMRSFGVVTLVRLVMLKRILSPTRARTVGPGSWSPSVHAVYFTPGAISNSLFDASRRTSFTGLGSSGCSAGSKLRLLPVAYGPERSSSTTTAAEGSTSDFGLGDSVASQPPSAAASAVPNNITSEGLVILCRLGENFRCVARNSRASACEPSCISELGVRCSDRATGKAAALVASAQRAHAAKELRN